MYDFLKGIEMEINYKKTILSTIGLTLSVLLAISLIFVSLMYFVFTKSFADFCYSLGNKNMASNLYYKVYEKNDDIYYCYKALNIKIVLGKDKDVVKYYKEFASDNEYVDFMEYLNENNENANVGILEKSVLLNEDNYLKRNFISSLIKTGRYSEGFDYALEYFSDYASFDFYNQGVYAFNYFILDGKKFNVVYDEYSVYLIDAVQSYFDNSCLIFEENKYCDRASDKAYLISLGNRIIQVGEDLNKLYEDNNLALIEKNNQNMRNVNDVIKGVL